MYLQGVEEIMNDRAKHKIPLEKQLFHELHRKNINNPSIKEFKESWAFANAVRSYFNRGDFDVVIDVAGGHGCLAALMLVLTSAKRAVVIDPAEVGKNGVSRAWGDFYKGKNLVFRHECLRTGLREELDQTLNGMNVSAGRVIVLACHACQHLSDETLEISCEYGVHAAVMPCCQKDLDGSTWKSASKRLDIHFPSVMDILMAGKVMAWDSGKAAGVSYQVRMKSIDEKITPQNRIILCKASSRDDSSLSRKNKAKMEQHERLQRAYGKAHSKPTKRKKLDFSQQGFSLHSAMIGFVAGALLANFALIRTKR